MKREGASAQQQMIRVAEQLNGLHTFEQTFWVSALRAQGMAKLKDFLMERWAFPTTCSLSCESILTKSSALLSRCFTCFYESKTKVGFPSEMLNFRL